MMEFPEKRSSQQYEFYDEYQLNRIIIRRNYSPAGFVSQFELSIRVYKDLSFSPRLCSNFETPVCCIPADFGDSRS